MVRSSRRLSSRDSGTIVSEVSLAKTDGSQESIEDEHRCRSLPFIILFWLVFLGTQIAHRQTRLEQSLHTNIKNALSGENTDLQETNSSGSSSCDPSASASARRLVSAGGSGRSSRITGVANTQRLDSVSNVQDLILWMRRILIPLMWADSAQGRGVFTHFGRFVGGIRLQQRRLGRSPCPGSNDLQVVYNLSCYQQSLSSEEVRAVVTMPGVHVASDGMMVYWLDLSNPEADVSGQVDALEQLFFSAGTQTLWVQCIILFAQVRLMAFAEVEFWLDGIGRVKSDTKFMTLPTDVYEHGWIVWSGDVLLLLMILGLLAHEVWLATQACFAHKRYWEWLRALNWSIVMLGAGFSIFFAYLASKLALLSESIAATPDPPALGGDDAGWEARHRALDTTFSEVARLSGLMRGWELSTFWYCLLMLLKFFTAFEGSPRLAVVTASLRECATDLLYFMVVFVMIFVNFAVGAYFLFGHQLEEWASVHEAINSAFRALMGDFSFDDMYSIAPVSATAWFWLFMILIFLVMLNMLLTIVLETYANCKEKAAGQKTLWQQAGEVTRHVSTRTRQVSQRLSVRLSLRRSRREARSHSAPPPDLSAFRQAWSSDRLEREETSPIPSRELCQMRNLRRARAGTPPWFSEGRSQPQSEAGGSHPLADWSHPMPRLMNAPDKPSPFFSEGGKANPPAPWFSESIRSQSQSEPQSSQALGDSGAHPMPRLSEATDRPLS